MIIPDGVSAVEKNAGVFKAYIFQVSLVFEKKPVGNFHFQFSGIQQRIAALIFDQYTLKVHLVKTEKANAYMFNADAGLQVFRKSFCDLSGQPVLTCFSL